MHGNPLDRAGNEPNQKGKEHDIGKKRWKNKINESRERHLSNPSSNLIGISWKSILHLPPRELLEQEYFLGDLYLDHPKGVQWRSPISAG